MSNANLGTATFYITGNASGAANAANQANNALAQMERVVAQNWWGIQNLGLAFAALPAAVAAGTGAAIRSAIQWEDALAGVARTTYDVAKSQEENAAAASQLGGELIALSQRIPTSALEMAGIAEAAGALGVAGQDVAQFTETVANLANVTDLTNESAATNLARIAALTGVGAAGFDNLASAITTAGVTTAATESEIANLATRIAGVAKIVGLSADQVIGLAAATRSAGVQVEAGGTAIQKTFLDINAAVRAGGDDLEGWAQIAGMTGAELRSAFEADAASALVSVVSGLGDLNKAGGDVITMLDNVGVSEQRQIRTLLSLAAAQNQNINENVRLSTILGVTGNAFQDTQLYSEMLERRYNTLANQLQILKNQIFAAGQGLGSFFLPVVRQAVEFLQLMISTISGAPGPFKAFIAVFVGLATIITALGAAALLIGPRILIAHSALKQLEQSALQAANGQRILQAAQANTTVGMLRAIGITQQQTQALSVQGREAIKAAIATGNYANVQRAAAFAGINMNATALTTVTRMGTLITWAGRLATAFSWITLAITAATLAMAYFNRESNKQKAILEASGRARLDIINAMRQEQKGQEGATAAFVRSMPIYQALTGYAERAGVSQETLYGIISGGITDVDELNGALRNLGNSNEQWMDGTDSATQILQVLRNQYSNSAQEAGFLGSAIDDMNINIGDSGTVSEDAAKGLQKLADAITEVVDATLALPDAVREQEEALDGLEDAERELVDARKDLTDVARDIEDSERSLQTSRLDAIDAIYAVADAEEELADTQQDAADAVAEAEDALADAQDRRVDALDKIHDIEEKISELRRGPELKEITKATNKLRQAQLDLLKSHRQVSDAEWYLNYLREEGASNRDIEDAEIGLEQARIDETDANTELSDAEEDLNDLRDQSDEMEEIIDLERELASARRDLTEIDRTTRQAEEDLAEAREDANGRLLEQRERDLERARIDAGAAAEAVRDAEEELAEVREHTDLIEAVEDAERGVEDALWTLAEANVEVQKQTALMNGEQWDASRTAHALAEQLGILATKAPTPEQVARLQGFVTQLKNVPNIPIVPEIGTPKMPDMGGVMDDFAADLGEGFGTALDEAIQQAIDDAAEDGKKDNWFGRIDDNIKGWLDSAWDTFFEGGRELMRGLWQGISEQAGNFVGWLGQKLYDWIWKPFVDFFGVHSPSTKMHGLGLDIMQGLWNGMVQKGGELLGWVGGLPGKVIEKLGDFGGWLLDGGSRVVGGLWQGIQNGWAWLSETFKEWGGKIVTKITDGVFKIGAGIFNLGFNLVHGLWDGIFAAKDWILDKVKGFGEDILDKIEGGIGWLIPGSPSEFGLAIGEALGMGIEKSMRDILPDVKKAGMAVDRVLTSSLAALDAQHTLPFTVDEILLGSKGLSALTNPNLLTSLAPGTATTIVNNDTFNLEAHTDADPEDIVNEYIFAKRVRTRA